jgi:pSer/pThr/pTyr-binding forkhead associated (FHA) protein
MKLEVSQFGHKIFDVDIPKEDLFNGGDIYFGRADDCHVVLDDQQVSRHHAIITLEDGKPIIKKISSFGSLSVNGIEIQQINLKLSDIIVMTSYQVVIKDIPELEYLSSEKETINFDEPKDDSSENIATDYEESTVILDASNPVEDLFDSTEILDEVAVEDDVIIDQVLVTEEELNDSPIEDDFMSEDNDEVLEEDPVLNDSFEEEDTEEPAFAEESFEEDGFGNDGFADDGFADDGFGSEGGDAGESTQVFQSFANYSLKITGENAPFDRYNLNEPEMFIGRDSEKCKIILEDGEVSGVHAVIKKSLINCTLEDLNSSNGTLLNGERINKAELVAGDEFIIGSTTFEVFISSELLEQEQDILMPVEKNQMIEVEEIVEEEVEFDDLDHDSGEFGLTEPEEKSLFKKIWKDPKKRWGLIIIVLLLLFIMLDDEPEKKSKKPTKAQAKQSKNAVKKVNAKKSFSPEITEKLEQNYALALAKYEAGEYYESKEYLEIIRGIDPNYKDTATLLKLVQQGHEELVNLKKEEEAEKERKERQLKVEKLVLKAKEAVKAREVQVAESIFGQIMEVDPENYDVPQLKLEIDAYKKAKEEKRLAEVSKKAERKRMVDALAPAKTLFLKGEWFKAIDRLEKFLKLKGMDEDLVTDATSMLKKSQRKLSSKINPLLGKARSFKEGQDLKRAYETYGVILNHDPSNEESLNHRDSILQTLTNRSKKLYREALISESLSLFDEAKEKFQQVQQISPINSDYYNKATKRLTNYME